MVRKGPAREAGLKGKVEALAGALANDSGQQAPRRNDGRWVERLGKFRLDVVKCQEGRSGRKQPRRPAGLSGTGGTGDQGEPRWPATAAGNGGGRRQAPCPSP